MFNPKSFLTATVTTIILLGGKIAFGATYSCEGQSGELTKGEVIITLVKNPKTKCTKTDVVIFDERRGTIKNAPKD